MVRSKTVANTNLPQVEKETYRCTCCGEEFTKQDTNFYASYSMLNKQNNGRFTFCKKCTVDLFQFYLNQYNDIASAIYYTCRKIDLYFNISLVRVAEQQSKDKGTNVFSVYITKCASLPQYKNKTFDDSLPYITNTDTANQNSMELIEKWGENYDATQLIKLEKFYNDMCTAYDISTPSHKQLLKFICKLNLKMDQCLEENDTSGFAKLSAQYETMMKSAKFRPLDKISADAQTGIRTFSQIFEEVEKKGFINPTPIEENQDIVDKTIMYMLNYTRKLVGVQKLTTPPIDTPKVNDDDKVVDVNDIEVDLTQDVDDSLQEIVGEE